MTWVLNDAWVLVLSTVASNLLGIAVALAAAAHLLLDRVPAVCKRTENGKTDCENGGRWLPPPGSAQRATELWFLGYAVFWVTCFAVIVGSEVYESFGSLQYLAVCGGLASPLLLQPLVAPSITGEASVPLAQRFSLHANMWIAIFGFVANYFYTHYFYRVLGAEYTMPSIDLNGVPIAMFFATHFYFTLYHTLSNLVLRRIRSAFEATTGRALFICAVVCAMSYITALTETITIAGFPCWKFEDWENAVTIGSSYYALYFVVSYPAFARLQGKGERENTLVKVATEALAASMAVLLLLDFTRLYLGIDFEMRHLRPCKIDPSRTCPPFKAC